MYSTGCVYEIIFSFCFVPKIPCFRIAFHENDLLVFRTNYCTLPLAEIRTSIKEYRVLIYSCVDE